MTRNQNIHSAAKTIQPKIAYPSFSIPVNNYQQIENQETIWRQSQQLATQMMEQEHQQRQMIQEGDEEDGFIIKRSSQMQFGQSEQIGGQINTHTNQFKSSSIIVPNQTTSFMHGHSRNKIFMTTQADAFQQSKITMNNSLARIQSENSSIQLRIQQNTNNSQSFLNIVNKSDVDMKQFNDVRECINTLHKGASSKKIGRNYNLMNKLPNDMKAQTGFVNQRQKRFEKIQGKRHSMVTNMQARNASIKQCSQSTVVDSPRDIQFQKSYAPMIKSTKYHGNRLNLQSRKTFATDGRISIGGKSTLSVRILPPKLSEDSEEDKEQDLEISDNSVKEKEVLVYETKQTSKDLSPKQIPEKQTTTQEEEVEESWKTLKFYDEDDFNPVHYLSQRIIKCRKYNYNVPESFGSSTVVLKYCNDTDALDIYKVDHLVNKSDNDDSNFILKGGKKLYQLDQLVKSIKMKDVKSFIYGPFSTRFWMMRMGINQLIVDNSWKTMFRRDHQEHKLSKEEENEQKRKFNEWQNCLPFYAWNCITLQMDDRDIDLVFFDDQSVKIFILFLIIKLDTYNGIRDSLNSLRKQKIIQPRIPTKVMMQKIFFNFFIMKFRMKMSFEACVQHRTLKELFLLAILKTYEQRNKLGLIAKPYPRITRRMLHRIRNLCFKGLTANTLSYEKNYQNSQKLQKQNRQDIRNQECQEEKNLINFLQCSILSKDDIDDLFEQHFESEESDDGYEQLYVRQTDQSIKNGDDDEQKYKFTSNKNERDKVYETEKIQNKHQQFKRRFHRTEKRSLYSKIMLLVKLRVLKGPIYIYALLECIKLTKSILILELELGKEAAIPYEFNIKQYPCCFQYYDCLIEVISRNFSQEQKVILRKKFERKYQSQNRILESNKANKIAKQKRVSIGERISREFKSFFSNDDMQDPKQIRNQEYHSYLKLFNKAENIQNARYIELNKFQLRRTNKMDQAALSEVTESQFQTQRLNSEPQNGLRCLSYSTYENMDQFDGKDKVKADDLQIDLNYITQCQVGRKRQDLFVKKVLYQNQLTALKQKGKRLLMCERINAQALEQTEEFLNAIDEMRRNSEVIQNPNNLENAVDNPENEITDQDLKNFIDYLGGFTDNFNKASVLEQEDAVMRHRAKLIKGILSRRNFQEINNYLDLKIKYDQRFFQKGYAEYQQFMSDIRKQICLNEQILRLREHLKELQDKLDKKHQEMYSTLGDSNKKEERMKQLQQQNELLNKFRQQAEIKYKELNIQLQKDSESKQKQTKDKLNRLMIRNKKNALKPDLDQIKIEEQSQNKYLTSMRLANEDVHERVQSIKNSHQENMRISDAFESKKQTPKLSQRLIKKQKTQREQRSEEANVESDELVSSSHSQCNEVLSRIDSSYPSFQDEPYEEEEDCDNSIDLVHQRVVKNIKEESTMNQKNVILERMKQMVQLSAKTKMGSINGPNTLFGQLAQAISHYDERCPINKEINKVKSKIVRKRARIHLVQTEGQKPLWHKNGSYEPAQIYQQSKQSLVQSQNHQKHEA